MGRSTEEAGKRSALKAQRATFDALDKLIKDEQIILPGQQLSGLKKFIADRSTHTLQMLDQQFSGNKAADMPHLLHYVARCFSRYSPHKGTRAIWYRRLMELWTENKRRYHVADTSNETANRSAKLEFATVVAQSAAWEVLSTLYGTSAPFSNKPVNFEKNRSTRADYEAHDIIRERILNSEFSADAFYSEEEYEQAIENDPSKKIPEIEYRRLKLSIENTWVVDALDGTGNFEREIPFFCTAIGSLSNGRPELGVVFDPFHGEVFFAAEGLPLRHRRFPFGEAMIVKAQKPVESASQAVLGIHLSTRKTAAQGLAAIKLALVQQGLDQVNKNAKSKRTNREAEFLASPIMNLSLGVRHIRAFGSSQLALAYVAAGRIDGFLQLEARLWDQVAGISLVRRGGGVVIDLDTEREWTSSTQNFLAARTRKLGTELLKLWKESLDPKVRV